MEACMQELLKEIRESVNYSQVEMAEELGVSFATINRWENGHVIPNKLAQDKIYDFCVKHSVSLYDFIIHKVQGLAKTIKVEEGRIVLYHGSKSGLEGKIEPKSRDKCDFGKGFYMGTEPSQSLTLICDFPKSEFYIVSLDKKDLESIEIPADIEWAMLVAYHRGRIDKIKETKLYEKYENYLSGKDLAIGSIANDRMFYVIDNFFQELITDEALVGSLSALQLGKQYVMLTQKGCDKVRIEMKVELSWLERRCLQMVSEKNRIKGVNMANEICKNYRREGKFFDEILDTALKGEN
jgi:transcriptional regulator with XRE-family HTH domain